MNRTLRATATLALLTIHLLPFSGPAAAVAAQGEPPGATSPAGPVPPAAPVTWDVETAVRTALAKHPQVMQADAETDAARARKGQAASGFYPAISLSAGASSVRSFSATTQTTSTTRNMFLQGNATQLLTDFGRTSASVRRADALLDAAREQGHTAREDVAFNARVAFYDALRAARLVRVREETLRQREALLRQAQAYHEAGIRAKIDVARAEANLFQSRAELTQAESDLRVARVALLNRMGIDGPADFVLVDTLAADNVPGAMTDWIREAERNRPELKAFHAREKAAAEALAVARGGYYPTLVGSGSYGYAADQAPLKEGYSLSLLLSAPLFSGFSTREQVAEAASGLASARYASLETLRLVRLQVEQAGLSVQGAIDRIAAREKEKEASGENLKLATGRYEVGVGDIIEIIDAQVQMTQAQTSLLDAQFDHSISVAALLRAMGR